MYNIDVSLVYHQPNPNLLFMRNVSFIPDPLCTHGTKLTWTVTHSPNLNFMIHIQHSPFVQRTFIHLATYESAISTESAFYSVLLFKFNNIFLALIPTEVTTPFD